MRKHVRLLFTCAFAAALGGGLFSTTSVRATLFTGNVDADINTPGNWDAGLPDNSGNPGTVPTGFAHVTHMTSTPSTSMEKHYLRGDFDAYRAELVRVEIATLDVQGVQFLVATGDDCSRA